LKNTENYFHFLQQRTNHVQLKANGKKCSRSWESHGRYMDCGQGVPLCGVLVLETGKGNGVYRHNHPQVHGLWPQVKHYGASQCIAPDDSADPNFLSPCYAQEDGTKEHLMWFQQHEWDQHGKCSGVQNVHDYLGQVCSLAARPLQIVEGAQVAGLDLVATAEQMERLGYCVWNTMSHSQIMLSVCAGKDGRWKLADVEEFSVVCGSGDQPSPSPASPLVGQCVPDRHGPWCASDADCAQLTGCSHCANSGFCTNVVQQPSPLPSPPATSGQCLPNKHGPQCESNEDCSKFTDCLRCAHSGYCTSVPLQ